MNQTQKSYEYDEVLAFAGSNGTMDSTLRELQKHLKELRDLVNRAEPLYHGKGTTSPIYNQYKTLYANIGNPNQGLWNQVNGAAQLQNAIYSNAKDDKDRDQGA